MSRANSNLVNDANLPEIKSTYHESYGGSGGYMGAGYQGGQKRFTPVPPTPRQVDPSRLEYLESRMQSQERNAQTLLDRAMKIKEDVIENLNLTHSTWQDEKRQRELLQDHIRAITDLVKKMDRDIRYLEEQVKVKDGVLINTGSSMKAIELQQATSITDMRGRIARCDAAITKLATDQQSMQDGLKSASNSQQDMYQRLLDKIQAVEVKLAESKHNYERVATETRASVKTKEDNSDKQSELLEAKLRSAVDDMKLKLTKERQYSETERQKVQSQLTLSMEKMDSSMKDKLDRLEQKFDKEIVKVTHSIEQMKVSVDEIKELKRYQLDMDRKLTAMIERSVRSQDERLTGFKTEFRQGFATVQDALASSKKVLEAKIALSEEGMRKEIAHVKRMVVVI